MRQMTSSRAFFGNGEYTEQAAKAEAERDRAALLILGPDFLP